MTRRPDESAVRAAGVEVLRARLVARYVAAGWERSDAEGAARRTYARGYVRTISTLYLRSVVAENSTSADAVSA